ncbi:MAG TPA: F0F1 ATP synthase subunit A [Longimicrobiales bacterium]
MTGNLLAMLSAAAAETGGEFDISEMILHHLADSHTWETPFGVVNLPQFAPVHIGPLTVDFSITKHVLFMMIAAVMVAITLIIAGRDAARERTAGAERGPKGAANVVEAMILFIRDEVAVKNIGHDGAKYTPFIASIFFFILFCNALGLLPWGASPTGNVSVTAALAIMTFIMVEAAGMKALGAGYLKTIVYWPHDMPLSVKLPMTFIMTPVELMGKFTKPFALTMRLYANMTAGHAVVLALTGLAVMSALAGAKFIGIALAPVVMATAIMILEIGVAFLQAYIFAMLTAVFIGLIKHAH